MFSDALDSHLEKIGFKQNVADPCVWTRTRNGKHVAVRSDGMQATAVLEAALLDLGVDRLRGLLVVLERPLIARAALQPRLPVASSRHPGAPMEA